MTVMTKEQLDAHLADAATKATGDFVARKAQADAALATLRNQVAKRHADRDAVAATIDALTAKALIDDTALAALSQGRAAFDSLTSVIEAAGPAVTAAEAEARQAAGTLANLAKSARADALAAYVEAVRDDEDGPKAPISRVGTVISAATGTTSTSPIGVRRAKASRRCSMAA